VYIEDDTKAASRESRFFWSNIGVTLKFGLCVVQVH